MRRIIHTTHSPMSLPRSAHETLLRLWIRALTETLGTRADAEHQAEYARRMARSMTRADELRVWPNPRTPRAVVALRRTQSAAFGGPVERVSLIADPIDDPAMRALPSLLALLPAPTLTPRLLEPMWSLRGVAEPLQELGYGIDGLSLLGDVQESVQRCAVDPRVPETRVLNTRELDAMLELRRLVFHGDQSPWGWFIGQPQEHEHRRQRFLEAPAIGRTLHIEGETIGYFCALPNARAMVPNAVGIELAIHPEFQGRGLGRQLMEAGLYELDRHSVRYYSGVSARPEVLRMARSFGRVPTRVMMRVGATTLADDFSAHYPFTTPKR